MPDDHFLPLLVTTTGVLALISPTPLQVIWLVALGVVAILHVREGSRGPRPRGVRPQPG